MGSDAFAWISVAVLNLGVAFILVATLRGVNIKAVLREKDPNNQPAAVVGQDAAAQADAALMNTSYSRLSGFIGSVVLACFLWAISNYVIYASFHEPATIPEYLKSLGSYFLAGASLFAPYAVNQLSKIFKPG